MQVGTRKLQGTAEWSSKGRILIFHGGYYYHHIMVVVVGKTSEHTQQHILSIRELQTTVPYRKV